MKAKEMFEELGYKLTKYDLVDVIKRYEYNKETKLETGGTRHQCIYFDLINKEMYIHNSINLEELKAINKQIEELGWNK